MSLIALALLAAGPAFAAPAWHAELGLSERDGRTVYVRHHPRTGVPAEHVLTAAEQALVAEALAKIPDASWKAGAARLVLAALGEHGIPPASTRWFEDDKGSVLTEAGLEAVPGAILKDPFAGKLFTWPSVSVEPPREDVVAAAARVTRGLAFQRELARAMGLSDGARASARVVAVPAPAVAKREGEAEGLLRKLPDEARGVLRYVAGVAVADRSRAPAAKTTWEALNLTSSVQVKPGKRDVFLGVAGQW